MGVHYVPQATVCGLSLWLCCHAASLAGMQFPSAWAPRAMLQQICTQQWHAHSAPVMWSHQCARGMGTSTSCSKHRCVLRCRWL